MMKKHLRIITSLVLINVLFTRISSGQIIWQEQLNYLGPDVDEEKLRQLDFGPNMTYFLVNVGGGYYRAENLRCEADLINTHVSIEDIQYHFYSTKDPYGGTVIKEGELRYLANSNFNVSKDTFIIIHGWINNWFAHNYFWELNFMIKEAVLSKYDVNVIIVNWYAVAQRDYISAKESTPNVGKRIASFLSSLVDTFKLELSSVTIVGHSLGAHVAGSTGAALKGQINQIVGLDPAAPLFSYSNIDQRLDPSDAQFVQAIHTNGMTLGLYLNIGHADYYPNDGMQQPGCSWDDRIDGICSHCRAYKLYAESIAAPRNLFIATQCSTYIQFYFGLCKGNPTSVMGGYNVDKMARGTYYLKTAGTEPYALG